MLTPYFIEDPLRDLWPPGEAQLFRSDDRGILTVTYSHSLRHGRYGHIVDQYHPTAISAHALSRFTTFVNSGDSESKDVFLKQADWLVLNLREMGDFAGWVYDVRWRAPGYRADPPFISSMGQGMGISVLVRAWQTTGSPAYLSTAERALSPFLVPTAAGGLLCFDTSGDTWYEGTPSPIGAQVLNEVLFALVGLYELHSVAANPTAKDLFDRGVDTIRRHLDDFDLDLWIFKWSKYDTKWHFYSGDKYHTIHVKQLKWLAEVTGDDLFSQYCHKWAHWQQKYGRTGALSARQVFLVLWRLYLGFLMLYTRYVKEETAVT